MDPSIPQASTDGDDNDEVVSEPVTRQEQQRDRRSDLGQDRVDALARTVALRQHPRPRHRARQQDGRRAQHVVEDARGLHADRAHSLGAALWTG